MLSKPTPNDLIYLTLIMILSATLLYFMLATPSIDEAAQELCNYSDKYIGYDTSYEGLTFNIEINGGLQNETPKNNSTHTQKPSS